MGDDALIPLKLFTSSTFSVATILGVLVGFGMFGAISTVPLYLQLVKGSTPTESGFQLLPMILGLMISSIVSGQLISRTGRYKIFPIIGTGFMVIGFLIFTTITADSNYLVLAGARLLVGLGLGQLMQTLTIASQNAVGARDIGVATSSSTFFRQVGGTLGVAVIFSVVFSVVGGFIKANFGDRGILRAALDAALNPAIADAPANKAIMSKIYDPIVGPIKQNLPAQIDLSNTTTRHQVVDSVLAKIAPGSTGGGSASASLDGNTSFLTDANHALAAPFLSGFSDAMVRGFWVSLVVVLVAFILSFFLKATPLREKSAIQEVADQDAAILATQAAEMMGAPLEADTSSRDYDSRGIPGRAGVTDRSGGVSAEGRVGTTPEL